MKWEERKVFPQRGCHRKVRPHEKESGQQHRVLWTLGERRKHISLGCHYDTPQKEMLCFVILEDNVEASEQSVKIRSPEKKLNIDSQFIKWVNICNSRQVIVLDTGVQYIWFL